MAKILIDATSLIRKATGIEYYTLQIIKKLLEYDNSNEYIILFKEKINDELKGLSKKCKLLICKNKSQIYCEQIWIPLMIKREKPDIVHFPAFPPGLFVNHNNIIFTLHDATMWRYRQTLSWKNKLYMKPLSSLAMRKSEKVFTVSNDSKENIIKYFPEFKNKVKVTGESISDRFKIIDNIELINNIRNKYSLNKDYILSVCSLEPRKNIVRLLEAYKLLLDSNNYDNIPLVLVGRLAWGKNEVENKIKELNIEKNVIITGYVSDEDLLSLYNGATCFVCPSLYEGFGLPVLEAMACGIPVITSNTSSLPEVAGDAAILCDPKDVVDISKAINKVISNLDIRLEMKRRGFLQLKKYDWQKIVEYMINLYTNK